MCSGEGHRTLLLRGFPIRISSDLSLVGSSPRLFAASHVLHRLLVPRHPPCALNNLATKMLASTMQFSNHKRHQPTPTTCPQPIHTQGEDDRSSLAGQPARTERHP